jgi:hypothetical protein
MQFSPTISFIWALIFFYFGGVFIESNSMLVTSIGSVSSILGVLSAIYFSKTSHNITNWQLILTAFIALFLAMFILNRVIPNASIWTDMSILSIALSLVTAAAFRIFKPIK